MARYGKKAGKKVKSRKQAIAIGLSEARRSGAKVPAKRKGSAKRKGAKKSSSRRRKKGGSKKRKSSGKRKSGKKRA